MKPFRYAYIAFNPQYIVNAYRETVKNRFYVTITFTVGAPIRIRAIDEVEQERTLEAFLTAWETAALSL